MRTLLFPTVAVCAFASGASAQPIIVDFAEPSIDQWVYPFNSTPGGRDSMSTFGAIGSPDFDNRDGQALVGFDTAGFVPTGEGPSRYQIQRIEIRIAVDRGGLFSYDPTYDDVATYYDAADPDFMPDADTGRPVSLFGVGYRNGFDDATFVEGTAFGGNGSTFRSVRNAFASDFESSVRRDVSNNVDGRFNPTPFAVGTTSGLNPGDLVPADQDFLFEVDLSNPDAVAYLQEQLHAGRLRFMLASLHPAVEQGGEFAPFYTKENLFGDGLAARLHLEVTIGSPADLNGDGVVDGADLGLLLGAWGADGPTDLNGDGTTDGADLGLLLGSWG